MVLAGTWLRRSQGGWTSRLFATFQISRLIISFSLLIVGCYGISLRSHNKKLNNNDFFLTVILMINLQQLIAINKLSGIERILDLFRVIWSKRESQFDWIMFSKETAIAWRIYLFFKVAVTWNIIVYLLIPSVIDAMLAIFTSDTRPYFVPVPLSEYLEVEGGQERSPYYYFVTLTSSVWLQVNAATCVGIQSVFCVLVVYTVAEIKMLKYHILQLRINSDRKFDESSPFTIGLIVREHQAIIRLYQEIKDYIGPQLAIQYFISSVSMCIGFYVMSTEVDPIVIGGSTIMFLSFLGLMFFVCQLGETLSTQGISIHNIMYNIPWYNLSSSARRDVWLVIMQAQRPMTISYRGTCIIDAETFTQVVNATYSYFTLLKTLF